MRVCGLGGGGGGGVGEGGLPLYRSGSVFNLTQ